MSLQDLHALLGIAHDLVCSVLLVVLVLFLNRAHSQNTERLDSIRRRLGILERDQD